MTDVMTATFVDAEKRPLSFEQAAPAMKAALSNQLGHDPSDEVLALALAKTALETGRWQSMWNDNWGNIKAGIAYVGMYTAFACNEVLNGVLTWFSPKGRLDHEGGTVIAEWYDAEPWHPQTRFRAYANEFDGCYSYVDLISTGRYKVAWAMLLSGSVTGFVHELKMAGYFTADESLYLKGVQGLYNEMLARVKQLPADHLIPEINYDLLLATIKGDQFAHVNDGDDRDQHPFQDA